MHFGTTCFTDDNTEQIEYNHLNKIIQQSNHPNLIILTGDVFQCETKDQAIKLFNFLDELKTPWIYIYGNHDIKTFDDDTTLYDLISSSKYSIFIDYLDDEIDGDENFYVNLNVKKVSIYRLFIIDSNSSSPSNIVTTSDYDIIHDHQLTHIATIQQLKHDNAKCLAFFHIPLTEYEDAWHKYEQGIINGKGEKREDVCYGYKNNGALTILSQSNIQGCFVGHDHINNFDIDYPYYSKQILLSYGLKSTQLSYYDDDLIGYKIITLPMNDTLIDSSNVEAFYVPYE